MKGLSKFDDIRSFTDEEANGILKEISRHPMVFSIMKMVNPEIKKEDAVKFVESIDSITDFQRRFSYPGLKLIIDKTSDGLFVDGLSDLDTNGSYLFISTHRDIILDASFLNVLMIEEGMKVCEAAIGDNLVKKDIVYKLARLNRNFIVKRDAPVREMIENSRHLSEYIQFVIHKMVRSVWIAQREGRTKDGKDATNPGLLKMIVMSATKGEDVVEFLKKTKIVPLAVSYEYDPNDRFKIDELIARENDLPYMKDKNEDFQQILMGVMGNKKRIHIGVGKPLDKELDELKELRGNKLLKRLAEIIDYKISEKYKLWPSNFIAYDLLNNTKEYEHLYNKLEKKAFLRRVEKRAIQHENDEAQRTFLEIYANPVVNKRNLGISVS